MTATGWPPAPPAGSTTVPPPDPPPLPSRTGASSAWAEHASHFLSPASGGYVDSAGTFYAGYFDNFGRWHAGSTRTAQAAAQPDAEPDRLRDAARQLAAMRDTVDHHRFALRGAMGDLLDGRGQWYGPAATAFRTDVWTPLDSTLGELWQQLDALRSTLMTAAVDIEDAYEERKQALEEAVALAVACTALAFLTWGISEIGAEAAAAAAIATCARVVDTVAGILRLVAETVEATADVVGDLVRSLGAVAELRNAASAFNLASDLGRLTAIPAVAGAGSGVLFSVSIGATDPLDLVTNAVGGAVDAAGGGSDDGFTQIYTRSDGSVERIDGDIATVVPKGAEPDGDIVTISGQGVGRIRIGAPMIADVPGTINEGAKRFTPKERAIAEYSASQGHDVVAEPESTDHGVRKFDAYVDADPAEFKTPNKNRSDTIKGLLEDAAGQFDGVPDGSVTTVVVDGRPAQVDGSTARTAVERFLGKPESAAVMRIVVIGDGWELVYTR